MPLVATRAVGNYAFKVSIDDTALFHYLLKTLVFRETGVIFVYANGLRIVVEDYKAIQGNLYIKRELFSTYHFVPETSDNVKLRLNLNHLVECLSLYTTKSSPEVPLELAYRGYGYPLKVVMGDGSYATSCRIKTLDCESEDIMNFGFETHEINSKAIFQTGIMREVFADMDPEASHLFVSLSTNGPPQDYFTKEVMDPAGSDFSLMRTQESQSQVTDVQNDGQEPGTSQATSLSHLDDYAPIDSGDESEEDLAGGGDGVSAPQGNGFIRFSVKTLDLYSASYDFNENHPSLERFVCFKTVRNKYEMELVKRMAKTMGIADKVSVRTDKQGVLSFQYLIPIKDGDFCFIEFYCMPEQDGTIPEEELDISEPEEETTMDTTA